MRKRRTGGTRNSDNYWNYWMCASPYGGKKVPKGQTWEGCVCGMQLYRMGTFEEQSVTNIQ